MKRTIPCKCVKAYLSPVQLYLLDQAGAVVGVSITGAKYYKDSKLN